LRERGSGTREIFEEAMARLGLTDLSVKAEMGSTAMIKSALAYSASAGVLSRLAVFHEVERSELVHVEVEGLDLSRSLYAIWSKRRGISAIERELLRTAIRS
jgi:DNA-binding transcriptional LysR family regulator